MELEKQLKDMIDERQVFIDEREEYYNRFSDEELGSDDFEDLEEHPRCEELLIQIYDFIKLNHKNLKIESVIEGLTSIGHAPSILYDDAGNFAVGGDGIQGVRLNSEVKELNPEDDLDFGGTWFLKRKHWKKTIREALDEYFNEDE